jgi:hypothetical protein
MQLKVLFSITALLIAASLAEAQTTTADGIDAFVRGDYQRAVEILKPLAERWPLKGDAVAEFVMGVLYTNGLGVPRDPVRACALYTGTSGDGPFGRQTAELFRALHASLSTEDRERCLLLSTLGFDHRFEPVTFALDHGHWIGFDLGSQSVVATIAYNGHETRIDVGLAHFHGSVFLPIQHTELPTEPTRRHFVEFITWATPKKGTWVLMWHLFEVVRDELLVITAEELVTIAAERPPTGPPVDVRSMAQVRLTDTGDAEWAVLIGPHARSELIESDAERQEVKEHDRRRRAAAAGVDWTRARDPDRPPALAYADAEGCGNVFVYGWSADRTEAITVRADKDALGLSTTPRTFDIAQHQGGLELAVHVFESPQRRWPFCTHVRMESPDVQERWIATAGAVTIALSPPEIRVRSPHLYRATIHIVGAEFVSATGVRVRQMQPITLMALVGWGPG